MEHNLINQVKKGIQCFRVAWKLLAVAGRLQTWWGHFPALWNKLLSEEYFHHW